LVGPPGNPEKETAEICEEGRHAKNLKLVGEIKK
jgi:hypothetical protein